MLSDYVGFLRLFIFYMCLKKKVPRGLPGSRRPTPWAKMACARRYPRGCECAPGLTDLGLHGS